MEKKIYTYCFSWYNFSTKVGIIMANNEKEAKEKLIATYGEEIFNVWFSIDVAEFDEHGINEIYYG